MTKDIGLYVIVILAITGVIANTINYFRKHSVVQPKPKKYKLDFRIGPISIKNIGGEMMLILTNVQKCLLSLNIVDEYGNPTAVDGLPTWSVSDPNVLSLEVQPDGLSAWVVAVGPTGGSQVSVTVDADMSGEVRNITGVLDVEVKPSEAVAINIAAGVPEHK